MSYDLFRNANQLVSQYTPDERGRAFLTSEFGKWNHPIRMKFVVSAAVAHNTYQFLHDLLDIAQEKNALMVGPLVFEQVYSLADNVHVKHQVYEVAKKSLTLRPPKQLHGRCQNLALKNNWRWVGLLIPYLKDDGIVVRLHNQLIADILYWSEHTDQMGKNQAETLSNALEEMFFNDPRGAERWKQVSPDVLRTSGGQAIEARWNKDKLASVVSEGVCSVKRKM